jgi:putative flippase GtrA
MQTMLAEARRITRFGLVGVAALLTHMAVAWLVLERLTGSPYAASLAGFLVAFCVSFLGHHHFTFAGGQDYIRTLPRFFLVALSGFLAKMVSMMVSILVIPALTYLAARLWAFAR